VRECTSGGRDEGWIWEGLVRGECKVRGTVGMMGGGLADFRRDGGSTTVSLLLREFITLRYGECLCSLVFDGEGMLQL
jgi:hypothetical protein